MNFKLSEAIRFMTKMLILTLFLALLLGCVAQETENKNTSNETSNQLITTEKPRQPPVQQQQPLLPPTQNTMDVLTTETEFPEIPKFNFSNTTTSDGRLIVYFFFSPYCVASKAIRPEIDKLEDKYPDVDWEEYDIATQNGTYAYLDFAEQYNLSKEKRLVPQVLVNGIIITDRFNINKSLDGAIQNFNS